MEIFHHLEEHFLDNAHVRHKPSHFHVFLCKRSINFKALERNQQQQKQHQQQQQQQQQRRQQR